MTCNEGSIFAQWRQWWFLSSNLWTATIRKHESGSATDCAEHAPIGAASLFFIHQFQ
jgi:hypothetical protein